MLICTLTKTVYISTLIISRRRCALQYINRKGRRLNVRMFLTKIDSDHGLISYHLSCSFIPFRPKINIKEYCKTNKLTISPGQGERFESMHKITVKCGGTLHKNLCAQASRRYLSRKKIILIHTTHRTRTICNLCYVNFLMCKIFFQRLNYCE